MIRMKHERCRFCLLKNWSTYSDYGKIYAMTQAGCHAKKMEITIRQRLLHCLPVRRNVELSDEVLGQWKQLSDTAAGIVFWAAQAVLSEILKIVGSRQFTVGSQYLPLATADCYFVRNMNKLYILRSGATYLTMTRSSFFLKILLLSRHENFGAWRWKNCD